MKAVLETKYSDGSPIKVEWSTSIYHGKVGIVLGKKKKADIYLVQMLERKVCLLGNVLREVKNPLSKEDKKAILAIKKSIKAKAKVKANKKPKAKILPKDLHKRFTAQALYDIYALIYVYTRTSCKEAKFSIAFDLDEYRQKFLGEAQSICIRELRHLHPQCPAWNHDESIPYLDKRFTLRFRKKINRVLREQYGAENSSGSVHNKYFKGFLTFAELNTVLKKKDLFNWHMTKVLFGDNSALSESWDEAYAGSNWIDFADACYNLESSSYEKLWFTIDRVINLCHNGDGNFIDKFYHYKDISHAANWLSDAETKIEEVLQKASSGVSGNCRRYLRELSLGVLT